VDLGAYPLASMQDATAATPLPGGMQVQDEWFTRS
jgi:hypothetical protein